MTDTLTDILESIRMKRSVFSRATLHAPWGVESGKLPNAIFHAVVEGEAWIRLVEGDERVLLKVGDVAFMPFGDNHLMTDRPTTPTKPIGLLTAVDRHRMGQLVVDGGGAETSLICGSVTFARDPSHPMLSMLPSLIHVRDRGTRMSHTIETMIMLIAQELDNRVPGTETVVARLTDALVVCLLRSCISNVVPEQHGWLVALHDPGLREALGVIHRRPERSWTAAELTTAAGMSRSTFFAQFRQVVGETPSDYLTRWRMHVASRLLREQHCSVASAAAQVGYATEAAFSNAFVRVVGMRPGAYKKAG